MKQPPSYETRIGGRSIQNCKATIDQFQRPDKQKIPFFLFN